MVFIVTLGELVLTAFILFYLIALGHMYLKDWIQGRKDRKKK